jgi:RNA polymerase sigma factor (sigma-70 family)
MDQAQAGTLVQYLRKLIHDQVPTEVADAQLLKRFTSERDDGAFGTLMLRHGPMVLGVARRVLRDTHDAEDVFQATFLVLARMGRSIRKGSTIGNWLYGVAYRLALKCRKGTAHRRQHERQAPTRGPSEAASDLALRDLQAVLDQEVSRLPEKYRAPFILCCLESKSRAEASQLLGWKEGTVASRLDHARKLLQKRLTRRGVTLSATLCATELSLHAAQAAVPLTLAASTLAGAQDFAMGKVTPIQSDRCVALANAWLQKAMVAKVQLACGCFMAVGLLAAAVGWAANQTQPAATPPLPGTEAKVADGQANPLIHGPRGDQYGDSLPEGSVARFGTLRLRNSGAMVFTPDGKQLLSTAGEAKSQIAFWDRQTGKETRRLSARATLNNLVLSPDGKVLATDGNVYNSPVWDVATGQELFTLDAYQGSCFTSDNKHLLGINNNSDKSLISMWEVPSGKKVGTWTLPVHSWSARCSPDGKTVAYLLKGQVVLYDLDKKAEKACWASAESLYLSFSPDGRLLSAAGGGPKGVRVWQVADGKEVFSCPQGADLRAVFSADGKHLAWSGRDERGIGCPWVAELELAQPRRLGAACNNPSGNVAFSPDGKTLALNTDAGAIELRDFATGKDVLPLDANTGRVYGLSLSTDGRHLITRDIFEVLVWDKATAKALRRFPADLPAGEIALLETVNAGKIVTARRAEGTLHLRDLVTGKEIRRLQCPPAFVGDDMILEKAAVTADGKSAAILGRTGIAFFDLTTGAHSTLYQPQLPVWAMNYSQGGRRLVCTLQDVKKGLVVAQVDPATGRELEPGLATANLQGGPWSDPWTPWLPRLQKLPLRDAKGQPAFADFKGSVQTVVEAPGGRLLAVRTSPQMPGTIGGEAKPVIRVWDAGTGELLDHIQPPPGQSLLAFSPDCRLLVTASLPGTVHLWEVASGQERLTLRGHIVGGIGSVLFTPDSRFLFTGGEDSQVLLFDLTHRAMDGAWRTVKLDMARRLELWDKLEGTDAAAANKAMWELAADPAGTMALLETKLQKVLVPDDKEIAGLIAELAAESFAKRQDAQLRLLKIGDGAAPALREALKKSPPLEQQRRLEKLAEELSSPRWVGYRLRLFRALEVLEHIGSPQSQRLLEQLAQGAAADRFTRAAKETLERLGQGGF